MPIEVENLSVGQLGNLIENHRRQQATDAPLYLDALREFENRKGKGLDFHKSMEIIRRAAEEGRFLSYKELADRSGVGWGQAHYAMGDHLWKLVEYSHRMEGVLLSAIVVNKTNLKTGKMDPETLTGFIGAARLLGYPVVDEKAFLKEQQARVFAWAQGEPAPTTA
jgi:hypothetical protein